MSVELDKETTAAIEAIKNDETIVGLEQYRKDWDAMLVAVANAVGTDDDREAVDMDPDFLNEFDPWEALRRARTNREHLSSALAAAEKERDEAQMLCRDARIQAMDRGASFQAAVAERDEARADLVKAQQQLDGRIQWQVSAVAHLRTWSELFDAAVAMREGHEGCLAEPACGDCFRCRFDNAVDEAMKAVAANSPASILDEVELARVTARLDAARAAAQSYTALASSTPPSPRTSARGRRSR